MTKPMHPVKEFIHLVANPQEQFPPGSKIEKAFMHNGKPFTLSIEHFSGTSGIVEGKGGFAHLNKMGEGTFRAIAQVDHPETGKPMAIIFHGKEARPGEKGNLEITHSPGIEPEPTIKRKFVVEVKELPAIEKENLLKIIHNRNDFNMLFVKSSLIDPKLRSVLIEKIPQRIRF